MNYFPELNKFLSQAKTSELGTSGYLKTFQELTVKVSFGQGNQAKIPWIAFLNSVDKVQNGIYPVYLFYKDKHLLILAFGISETNPPGRKWNISDVKTIEQYFKEQGLGKPERYGSSFVFKSYDTTQNLVEEEINKDLNEMISIYKANSSEIKSTTSPQEETFSHPGYLLNSEGQVLARAQEKQNLHRHLHSGSARIRASTRLFPWVPTGPIGSHYWVTQMHLIQKSM